MNTTVELFKAQVETFFAEFEKFEKGNKTAGTRARKALLETGKLTKTLRAEIQNTKNTS